MSKSNLFEAIVLGIIYTVILGIFISLGYNMVGYNTFDFLFLVMTWCITSLIIYGFIIYRFFEKKNIRNLIQDDINVIVNNLNAENGHSHILFGVKGQIYYASEYLNKVIDKEIIGKNIFEVFKEFQGNFKIGNTHFNVTLNNKYFQVIVDYERKIVVFHDQTLLRNFEKMHRDEQVAIYEFEIDAFENSIDIMTNEELLEIQNTINNSFKQLEKQYNFHYFKISTSKYFLFSNMITLRDLIEKKFSFMIKMSMDIKNDVTFSMGVSSSNYNLKKMFMNAKEGLLQCKLRGGSQVAYIQNDKKPKFFGSEIEMKTKVSRIEIKKISMALEAKFQSKNIQNVIIYGHENADLDAIGAAYGVAEIAKHYEKEVFIQNKTFDETTLASIKKIKLDKNIFISPAEADSKTTSQTLIVIVDVSDFDRIENKTLLKHPNLNLENIFVFDHHIYNQKINAETKSKISQYIEPNASSASEIIVEVISFFKKTIKLSNKCSQALLNGIFLDTMQFQKATTFRTFEAAAFLEKCGASTTFSSNMLKINEKDLNYYNKSIKNLCEVKEGYWLSWIEDEIDNDLIAKIAEDMLKIKGREASFFVARTSSKKFKLSARSIEKNVQIITEQLGGGGHFNTAAATTNESIEVFIKNIKQAIITNWN